MGARRTTTATVRTVLDILLHALTDNLCSLEQFRDWGPGLLERRSVLEVLRLPRRKGWFLLRGANPARIICQSAHLSNDSPCSDGETHPCTASVLRCSRRRTRFTSSTILVRDPRLFFHIHITDDRLTGYRHNPFQHCPQGELHKKGKCWCNPKENFGASQLMPLLTLPNTFSQTTSGTAA